MCSSKLLPLFVRVFHPFWHVHQPLPMFPFSLGDLGPEIFPGLLLFFRAAACVLLPCLPAIFGPPWSSTSLGRAAPGTDYGDCFLNGPHYL